MSPPPRGGQYSVSIICLARDLVVGGLSLRGAANALAIIVQHFGLGFATPCFSTIRTWILRLGCHALTCPLQDAADWIWLIDHTTQIGSQKLFAILGCPAANVPLGKRELKLSDMRLLALIPTTDTSQKAVAEQLEATVRRTGVPRVIVSDHACELKKGIELFQQRHPETAAVHDAAHYIANILENRWEHKPAWKEMIRLLSESNNKIRQSAEAYLLAPTLRPKGRFMNVGPLLRFLGRVLVLLDRSKPDSRVEQCYGWLRKYQEALEGWLEEYQVAHITLKYVRCHGVNADTIEVLEFLWGPLSPRIGPRMVAGHMRVYVRRYGCQARPGESLVVSTEVLESSFGKLKRLQGNANSGPTGMVLSLGTIAGQATEEQVRKAMEAVPEKEVHSWIKNAIGNTIRWFRRVFMGSSNAK